jgi:hypothetical protein
MCILQYFRGLATPFFNKNHRLFIYSTEISFFSIF